MRHYISITEADIVEADRRASLMSTWSYASRDREDFINSSTLDIAIRRQLDTSVNNTYNVFGLTAHGIKRTVKDGIKPGRYMVKLLGRFPGDT